MASHDCSIRGQLALKEGVTQDTIAQAFAPLLERYGIDLEACGIEVSDQVLNFSADVRGHGGADNEDVEAFARMLDPLLAKGDYIELRDYDTSDDETHCAPFFVGPTLDDRTRAQLEYGFEMMRPWVEKILGQFVVNDMKKRMMDDYIPW